MKFIKKRQDKVLETLYFGYDGYIIQRCDNIFKDGTLWFSQYYKKGLGFGQYTRFMEAQEFYDKYYSVLDKNV